MPKSLCLEPNCPEFAVYRGRCRGHARRNERDRKDPRARRVYDSKKWRLTRRRKLSMSPICERCGEELATEVHHVGGVLDDDTFDLSRLESLCARCHGEVGREAQLAR
jgi:hypothetical protein